MAVMTTACDIRWVLCSEAVGIVEGLAKQRQEEGGSRSRRWLRESEQE